ncbi:MAG TPA: division/cell wall cluster transcriptional repressor MraZ [Blastocatellia bacterium]|nr:division/cell wall cluster transcriptional repressor MraZ [Blastocatellia bacterium]
MLRGSYTARMDDKGRLKIPADFKRYLDQRYGNQNFYVTSINGECARLYPLAEWEEIENKLALLPSMETAKRKFLDRANYYGQLQQVDGQGRLLIHPLLRASAELLGDVTVLGYLTYLEVWSLEKFRRDRIDMQPFTDEDAEAIARLGI